MAAKKRPARRKAPAKKKTSNSKISEAQKAAVERRQQRDTLRQQSVAESNRTGGAKLEARTGTPMANSGKGVDQGKIAERDVGTAASKAANDTVNRLKNLPANLKNRSGQGNLSLSQAANKIAGLASPIIAKNAAERAKTVNALADPKLYGNSNKNRAAKIAELQNAYTTQATQQIKTQGRAVWMGPKTIKIRNQGPQRQDENGNTTSNEVGGDEVVTKEELMSWLTDDAKVKQIMAAAQKAGLDVQTYDDAAKLWGSVVDMAASSYSFAGKKVSPWSIIQLRGKNAGPGGKPKDRTITTSQIDELSPADARLMFEKTAQQTLGRSATKQEVDDFIAKAQTIAKASPSLTYETQHYGFDGEVESRDVRTSPSGAAAKQELAAMDQAKGSEDYSSYQAAGVYMPWLMDALASPI